MLFAFGAIDAHRMRIFIKKRVKKKKKNEEKFSTYTAFAYMFNRSIVSDRFEFYQNLSKIYPFTEKIHASIFDVDNKKK